MNKKYILSLVILLSFCLSNYAQQKEMYSQYLFNQLAINPGYTGARDGLSSTLIYRNQWVGFDGAPSSFSFTSHAPVSGDKVNVGLTLMHDRLGITRNTALYGSYAYRLPTDFGKFSFGLDVGFSVYKLKWDMANPIQADDNSFMIQPKGLFLPNAGIGVYYTYEKKYFAGISLPSLINNKLNFADNSVSTDRARQSQHFYFNGGAEFIINRDITIRPSLLFKYVGGSPAQMDFNFSGFFHNTVGIGASFRTGDAIVLLLEYKVQDYLWIGYAHDFTISGLSNYNNGTHEIMIRYDYVKSKIFRSKY